MPRLLPARTAALYAELAVSDMKASIDFYTTVLGFFYDHGVREQAWLSCPSVVLTLRLGQPQPGQWPCLTFTLGGAELLEAQYQHWHARGMRLGPPPDTALDTPHFALFDPDDYIISFCSVRLDYPEQRKPSVQKPVAK